MSMIFGNIIQNGYLVLDIYEAMMYWSNVMGVGPWYYTPHVVLSDFKYKGQHSPVDISIALSYSGHLQIELIQQHNNSPSLYRDFLATGHQGLHHIAYGTYSFEKDINHLLNIGYKIGHSGIVSGRGSFAYFLTEEQYPGTTIELLELSLERQQIFSFIANTVRNWNGKHPIRTVRSTDLLQS